MKDTHVFILEKDRRYSKGFPDTFPLPDDFLPENDFFQPKEAEIDWYIYSPEGMRSSRDRLPLEMNHLILKKWLSNQVFHYEHDKDFRKIRGKKFEEVKKIRLKTAVFPSGKLTTTWGDIKQ